METFNICVVCTGNICRSPFVEQILKRELDPEKYNIYSISLLGIEDAPAYEVCVKLAPEYLIQLNTHRSQSASEENVKKADHILVMTKQHLASIFHYSPKAKVELLSEYLPAGEKYALKSLGVVQKGSDIPDPMGESEKIVKPVLDLMQKATMNFIKTLE